MAKSTRKRVASFLADIANEDDTDLPRAEADEPPVITARGGGMPASSPQAVDEPASVRADKAQSAADRKDARPSAEAETPSAEAGIGGGEIVPAKAPATPAQEAPARRSRGGAAPNSRAPGLGHLLNNWGEQSREAEQWRRALEAGAVVQEIATELVTPFRWHDRFADFDDNAAFDALVESILREGQIAPALLRPHPTEAGKYELVYGHRRHRACAKLGRPLRAIVREMDDESAVTFLSRENSQHAPPSFIEKARQADLLLKDTGWTVQFTADVLGVQRSEVSRYRMVMTLPDRLVLQIGGDASVGRPTWMALETLWRDPAARERISAELDRIERQGVRGARAMRRLISAGKPPADDADVFRPRGSQEAVLRRDVTASADKIVIDKRLAGGFGDFLWAKLDDLWTEWHGKNE